MRVCNSQDCMLQENATDANRLAQLVVSAMAGDDISSFVGGHPDFSPDERCVNCALRVMSGKPPLPDAASCEAGRRSYRRHRRGH